MKKAALWERFIKSTSQLSLFKDYLHSCLSTYAILYFLTMWMTDNYFEMNRLFWCFFNMLSSMLFVIFSIHFLVYVLMDHEVFSLYRVGVKVLMLILINPKSTEEVLMVALIASACLYMIEIIKERWIPSVHVQIQKKNRFAQCE